MGGAIAAAGEPPLRTIDDVVARMDAIEAALTPTDGVRWFNQLYAATTREVGAAVKTGGFEDPEFLVALDVAFAELYFAALRAADGRPAPPLPRAWAPLFAARKHRETSRLQFAIAGMNAHINRDLMFALVDTFTRLRRTPADGSAIHRDFLRVNDILRAVEARIKKLFEGPLLGTIDAFLGNADDLLEIWCVAEARNAAWDHALTLWSLRGDPRAQDRFAARVDRMAAFAGRGLLAV